MDMRIKKLQLDQADYSGAITDVVPKFTARVREQNSRLANGYIDSPYFPDAISLGSENMKNAPIYKINVPGYFYRQHYKGNWTSSGTAGVLVADSPVAMNQSYLRMVYNVGSDGGIGHANNLFPILPGVSTYAYVVRDPNLPNNGVTREWLFVPTVLGASVNVRPEDFVSIVGVPDSPYDLIGAGNPGTTLQAWVGDWTTNFKSVCGWNVADESKITFYNQAAADKFKEERVKWISELGADLSDQGY